MLTIKGTLNLRRVYYKLQGNCSYTILRDYQLWLVPSLLLTFELNTDRSSRPEVFCKKGFLRNFTRFTGKH